MIKKTNIFTLINDVQEATPAYLLNSDSSDLVNSITGVKQKILGTDIELQVVFGDNYLVIMSNSYYMDNFLTIYYFDNQMKILDYLSIDSTMFGGNFKLKDIIEPNIIKFEFLLKDKAWVLTIKNQPKYILNIHTIYSQIYREGAIILKTYLKIKQEKYNS